MFYFPDLGKSARYRGRLEAAPCTLRRVGLMEKPSQGAAWQEAASVQLIELMREALGRAGSTVAAGGPGLAPPRGWGGHDTGDMS